MPTLPPPSVENVHPGPGRPYRELVSDSWIMHYKHGATPHCQKSFAFKGSLQEALKRAHDHARIMGYKVISIEPLMHDLEAEENGRQPSNMSGFVPVHQEILR